MLFLQNSWELHVLYSLNHFIVIQGKQTSLQHAGPFLAVYYLP